MRVWRLRSDSSDRATPLVMTRVLVGPGELDAAVARHEALLGLACDLRFDYPEADLRLASVGAVLLIEGTDAALAPFRATDATWLVSALEPYAERVVAAGGEVLEGPKAVPTGRNMLVRHAEGTVVEYVEHRPRPGEA